MGEHEQAVRRAAEVLGAATHLLIGAGAGASADSGLRTYEEAMREAEREGGPRLTYHDLCHPSALLEHKDAAYGFWLDSLRQYRAAAPHEGYAVLERLCASLPRGRTCVYSSNVDGLFRRLPALRASHLHEIHGCVEEWVCGAVCGASAAAAACATASNRITPPPPPGAWLAGAVPPCPTCGAHLRPRVLMFGEADGMLVGETGMSIAPCSSIRIPLCGWRPCTMCTGSAPHGVCRLLVNVCGSHGLLPCVFSVACHRHPLF